MKGFSLVAVAASVSLISASPLLLDKRCNDSDPDAPAVNDIFIQQFALTLEHLEADFYKQALGKFDQNSFAKTTNVAPFLRNRMRQIQQNEEVHVKTLTKSLQDAGQQPVKPCEYKFPINDVQSVIELSNALEHGGGAAYLGALPHIQDKGLQSVAASIGTIEHRQSGFITSSGKHEEGWDGSFENKLDFRQIFSIAANFIVKCPSDNFDLKLKAFPALKLDPASPKLGSTVKVSSDGVDTKNLHLAFITGLTPIVVPIQNGEAKVPDQMQGTVYAVVTKNDKGASDADTVAGPVEIRYPVPSGADSL